MTAPAKDVTSDLTNQNQDAGSEPISDTVRHISIDQRQSEVKPVGSESTEPQREHEHSCLQTNVIVNQNVCLPTSALCAVRVPLRLPYDTSLPSASRLTS